MNISGIPISCAVIEILAFIISFVYGSNEHAEIEKRVIKILEAYI